MMKNYTAVLAFIQGSGTNNKKAAGNPAAFIIMNCYE